MDAFGTGEVTFVTLLKGNCFMGHKPLILDRCPVAGYLVGVPRWLPMDGFGELGSALKARKQISKDLISLVGVWDYAQKPHSLSNDQAKMGCITSTCKRAEQVFPLSNRGAWVFPWSLQPPQSFRLLSRLRTHLGRYMGWGG
jgi:hypothetical protein